MALRHIFKFSRPRKITSFHCFKISISVHRIPPDEVLAIKGLELACDSVSHTGQGYSDTNAYIHIVILFSDVNAVGPVRRKVPFAGARAQGAMLRGM